MKARPFYNSPEYNFFAPNFHWEQPPQGLLETFFEKGFNCKIRTFDPYPEPDKVYFRSQAPGEREVWFRFSRVERMKKPRLTTTRLEIGELDVLGHEARANGEPGKIVFGFHRQMLLDVDPERGKGEHRFISDFYPIYLRPFESRQQIARGLHTIGAPLEIATSLGQIELNEHERLEWELERRELCERFYKENEPRMRY